MLMRIPYKIDNVAEMWMSDNIIVSQLININKTLLFCTIAKLCMYLNWGKMSK